MLIEPTLEKLYAMRLGAMAETWKEQSRDPEMAQLSFDERLGFLVDAEHLARYNRKLKRLLGQAKLRDRQACIEDLDYEERRGLQRAMIRQLTPCGWVDDHLNVIVHGATGVGKTFVACALGHQACRKGYRVLYLRVPRLFDELKFARADGTMVKLLSKFARTDVLVLDDWGLAAMKESQRLDMLEILEDRDGARSTIVTSQLPPDKWHDHIGDPTVADAILDRIVHRAHTLKLRGPSRRRQRKPT